MRKIISKKRENINILLLFLVISILSGLIIIKSGFIGGANFNVLHWQRIFEIKDSILEGNFFPKAVQPL